MRIRELAAVVSKRARRGKRIGLDCIKTELVIRELYLVLQEQILDGEKVTINGLCTLRPYYHTWWKRYCLRSRMIPSFAKRMGESFVENREVGK